MLGQDDIEAFVAHLDYHEMQKELALNQDAGGGRPARPENEDVPRQRVIHINLGDQQPD